MRTEEELAALSLPELLELLEPIPEPTPISYWPETAAWGWVLAVLVCLALALGAKALARWRANAYRRAALSELRGLADAPSEQAKLLRRTALVAFPRQDVASLIGDDWLGFLDRTLDRTLDRPLDQTSDRTDNAAPAEVREQTPGQRVFSTELGRALIASAYSSERASAAATDPAQTRALVARWIRDHHASPTGFRGGSESEA